MQSLTATYSPEDNKLRMYSLDRLDNALYQRIHGAGFNWAPKQRLFVAPAWTPAREDLMIELCGQIDDEDSTLQDRAEQRADRFEGYSENRLRDAEAAHSAALAISENIPLGQPVLVGHHSERHARRDAARIERNIGRAVEMAERSGYWDRRISGVIQNVEHKLAPDVRFRRIKSLAADQRKFEKQLKEAQLFQSGWNRADITQSVALNLANYYSISRCFPLADYPRDAPVSQYEGRRSLYSALSENVISAAQAQTIALAALARTIAWAQRWKAHTENRIAYERAQLQADNADPQQLAAQWEIATGGKIQVDGEWHTVRRVTRRDGQVLSVTAAAPARKHWRTQCVYAVESIQGYEAPTAEQAAAAKPITVPIVNFPGEGFASMTNAEYQAINTSYRGIRRAAANAEHGEYRYRRAVVDHRLVNVYLTDKKRIDLPTAAVPVPAEALAA
jgi:hypothetical protein